MMGRKPAALSASSMGMKSRKRGVSRRMSAQTYIVMAYILMAYIVMTYIVMAVYVVMAYIVMAQDVGHRPGRQGSAPR